MILHESCMIPISGLHLRLGEQFEHSAQFQFSLQPHCEVHTPVCQWRQ